MADEDKEKAEKLAAAKKRFEQLKKEQQKKGKKGGKKKDKETTDTKKDEAAEEDTPATEEAVEDTKADDQDEEETEAAPTDTKQRSASIAQSEVQELYRKQAAKIEELEKENKSLKEAQDTTTSKLSKTEEELEQLRESSSEIAELRTKAKETDRLTTELASVQRQLSQAQQASKGPARRQSGNDKDITEQLASKTSTIESLELDISNLRNQISSFETSLTEKETVIKDLEERAQTAESETASAKSELDALKVSISFPTDSSDNDPEALTKRITLLESDLRTANTSGSSASERAKSLEAKIEALTKLHKEATTSSQLKDRELADLRQKRTHRPSHVKDASDFELPSEEETLQSRIRALEAENFDLRRGVWRDKRAELQPNIDYDDVDLASPGGTRNTVPRQTSTFQDVITSGINAFTGRQRAESMGLMSDDGGFDEDAFRLAQEEEAKRRIERIREVKRGLDNWKGWRVDIADLRRNGMGPGRDVGPVFEI